MEKWMFQCEGGESVKRTGWEDDCYSRHSEQIQEEAEWIIWIILGYESGSDTDSSLLNHSKLLLCFVMLR